MSAEFPGTYRAVVVRNDDPQKSGRVTLRVPQILGNAESAWAVPSVPVQQVPHTGDLLFVTFEGGDIAHPVYQSNSGDTGVLPKPPSNLVLSKAPYFTAEGVGMVTITATWTAPTENQDGTTPVNVAGYSLGYSLDGTVWDEGYLTDQTTLAFSGVPAGSTVRVHVRSVGPSLQQSQPSTTASIVTAPATPPADSTLGQHSTSIQTALNIAKTADDKAVAAQNTANGKNKVTYSRNAPASTDANAFGDIWFQTDTNGTTIGQWFGGGGTTGAYVWNATQVSSQAIANLDVGKLTGGTMSANVVIGGEFRTADPGVKRTVIDTAGIHQYDADGTVLTDFPNDLAKDATITARINATALTVKDGLVMQGQSNSLAMGSKTNLATTVTGGAAPTLTGDWSTASTGSFTSANNGGTLVGLHDDTNGSGLGTTRAAYANPTGGTGRITYGGSTGGTGYYQWASGFTPKGLARVKIGSNARSVVLANTGTSDVLQVLDDSGLNINGSAVPVIKVSTTLGTPGVPSSGTVVSRTLGRSIGSNRAAEVVVATVYDNNVVDVNGGFVGRFVTTTRYALTDTAITVVATTDGVQIDRSGSKGSPPTANVLGVVFGASADMYFPAPARDTFVILKKSAVSSANAGASVIEAYTAPAAGTAPALIPAFAFPVPSDVIVLAALGDVASATTTAAFLAFRTVSSSLTPYVHTNVHNDPTAPVTTWMGYTWLSGSQSYESNLSPISGINLPARQRLTMTVPAYPDPAAGPGATRTADDVQYIRGYGKTGGTKPAASATVLQTTSSTQTLSITNALLTSGSAPPATTTFPASAAAIIQSAAVGSDGKQKLSLDGNGNIHGESVDVNGAVVAKSLTVPNGSITMGWTNYTVSWYQNDGTALVIGDGSIVGHYQQIGKTVHVRILWTRGTTTNVGTAGQYWQFSLPVAVADTKQSGSGLYYRGSGPVPGVVGFASSTIVYLMQAFSSTGARIGTSTPGAWASGDWISINLTYEAA